MKPTREKSKVSVVMATYNTEIKHLKLAIESILNQSMKDFIFYIVIDGGVDKKIVSEYTDKRIRIIEHIESKGLAFSLNEVIEQCDSDYLMRMDSDDISLPNRMQLQYDFMEKNKDIDISAMVAKKIGNENGFVYPIWYDRYSINSKLLFETVLVHPTVMFRMNFMKRLEIRYDTSFKYSQDYELWTRCVGIANISIIPRVGLLYRMHNKQISTSKKNVQEELAIRVLQRNLQQINMGNQYVEVFNVLGRRQDNFDVVKVSNMIDDIIFRCKDVPAYNQRRMEKVFYCSLAVCILKKRRYLKECLKNRTVIKKVVKIDMLIYLIRKIIFEIRYRIDLKINLRNI